MKAIKTWWPYALMFVLCCFTGFCASKYALSGFAYPFIGMGTLLNLMLKNNLALQILAYVLYILLGIIPLVILVLMALKKKARVYDYLILIILSFYLFMANYCFINPGIFLMYTPIHVTDDIKESLVNIYEIGLSAIFYGLIGVELTLRFFLNKNLSSKEGSFTIYTLAFLACYFFVFVKSGNLLGNWGTAPYFNSIIDLFSSYASYVLLAIALEHLKRIFFYSKAEKVSSQISKSGKRISKIGFILVMKSLLVDLIINLENLLNTVDTNISFTMDLPIIEFILGFVFVALGSYFAKAEKAQEDSNLTI
jgi:hypothetical protein